jgi:hypothetical protein
MPTKPVSFNLRLARVNHWGAYRIPLETGLLIPSDRSCRIMTPYQHARTWLLFGGHPFLIDIVFKSK